MNFNRVTLQHNSEFIIFFFLLFNGFSYNELEPIVADDYGIDWEGPVSIGSECDTDVQVDTTDRPLDQTQLNELVRVVEDSGFNVASATPWESVRCYLVVKNFVADCIQHLN